MKLSIASICCTFVFVISTISHAQPNPKARITSEPVAEANKPYALAFTLSRDPSTAPCGLRIDWGDGQVEMITVGIGQQLKPPYGPIVHTFRQPGKYNLRIQGQSMLISVQPGRPPFPSAACGIIDEMQVVVSGQEARTGMLSPTEVVGFRSLNPNFDAQNLLMQSEHTWGKKDQFGDNRRSLFMCAAQNSAERTILQGNEMSWRPDDSASRKQACNVWASFTEDLIKGTGLRVSSVKPDGRNQVSLSAKDGNGNDMTALVVDLGSSGFAGWYEVRGRGAFSQGTFVTPLQDKPLSGTAEYVGDITVNRSSRVSIEKITVDFGKNEIIIKGKFRESGDEGALQTIEPIRFNPQTGRFKGILNYSVYAPQGISSANVVVSGAVGGSAGALIAATLHTGWEPAFVAGTGTRVRKGFDLMLLQRE